MAALSEALRNEVKEYEADLTHRLQPSDHSEILAFARERKAEFEATGFKSWDSLFGSVALNAIRTGAGITRIIEWAKLDRRWHDQLLKAARFHRIRNGNYSPELASYIADIQIGIFNAPQKKRGTKDGIAYRNMIIQNTIFEISKYSRYMICLLYTSPSPRDLSTSRMPSSA